MINARKFQQLEGYEFECNLKKEIYSDKHSSYDEWGCAYIWLREEIGVEYNFCVDGEENCSAIYKMKFNKNTDYMETDTDTFVHYEIDFDDDNWKENLENAMCRAMIDMFYSRFDTENIDK